MYSCHNSTSVTWGRRSSMWIFAQSGSGRRPSGAPTTAKSRTSNAASSRSSGSGQPSPAAAARRAWSLTVVKGIPRDALTSRRLRPSPNLSRRTSRTLRMLIWGRGINISSIVVVDESSQGADAPHITSALRDLRFPGVGKRRNRCTDSIGTGVRKLSAPSVTAQSVLSPACRHALLAVSSFRQSTSNVGDPYEFTAMIEKMSRNMPSALIAPRQSESPA